MRQENVRPMSQDKVISNKEVSLERVGKRLDLLDERLDNIDTIVSTLVERVMKQTMTVDVVCPHCGRNLAVNVVGVVKMRP